MSIELLVTILGVFVLLLLSAFFSGSETALTAVSRARMHALEQEGNRRATLVNRLLAAPSRIISTVLLGNNLVNILATSLSTSLLIGLFGEAGVIYAAAIMTALVVIFSEVLPKTYAIAYPDRVALAVAPLMRGVIALLSPFTAALQWIVRQILKMTPSRKDDEANILNPHEELRGAIDLQKKEGAVVKGDADMLGGVLDLSQLQILDVMVHRTKMQTIDLGLPTREIMTAVLKSQYTRIPVWKDEPDNIVGLLHSKDLLAALDGLGWDVGRLDIRSIVKEAWFVPDTTSLKDQLNAFLKRKTQLALVVDEYGEVQGLVTLEDILEEIVGQIADEHDNEAAPIRPQPDGSVTVDGSVAIRDLNRLMDWTLPDEEATTVAGLVIHESQSIPEPGQTFTFHGYRIEILRKQRNRITALRLRPLPGATPARNAESSAPAGA